MQTFSNSRPGRVAVAVFLHLTQPLAATTVTTLTPIPACVPNFPRHWWHEMSVPVLSGQQLRAES